MISKLDHFCLLERFLPFVKEHVSLQPFLPLECLSTDIAGELRVRVLGDDVLLHVLLHIPEAAVGTLMPRICGVLKKRS